MLRYKITYVLPYLQRCGRKVYTRLSTGTSGDLTHSSNAVSEGNAALTKALLGNAGMSDTQRSTILNWTRGGNPGDAACSDASTGTACTAWRSWAHGDVQHSRPALVTYDPGTSPPSQYLFYASGTGYIHAVDSNTGAEKWTFLVEEALPQLAALMANATGEQIYVADGSPVVQFNDANKNGVVDGSDSVWLFFGLRRGGRAYYALDITDIRFVLVQDCIEPPEFERSAHFLLMNYVVRCVGDPTRVILNDEAEAFQWLPTAAALQLDLNEPTRILIEEAIRRGFIPSGVSPE